METTLKKCRRRSLRNLRRSSSSSHVIPARALLDASTEGGPYCDKISSSPYGSAWLGENTIEKLAKSSNSTPVVLESQVDADKIASTSPTDQYDELFVTDRSFKSIPPSLSPASPLNASSLSFQMKEFEDLVDKNQNSDWKPMSFQGLLSKKMDARSEGQTQTLKLSLSKSKSKSPNAKIGLNKDRLHGANISSSKKSTSKIASSTMKGSTGKMKSDMKLSLNYPKNCTLFRNPITKLTISESFKTKKDLTVNAHSSKTHKTVFPRSSLVSSSTSLNSFSSKIRHQADLCCPTSQSETEPTDHTSAEQTSVANDNDRNVKNIIHQLSSKLQALQTGMVTNRKLICESKQDREESMLPKKVRRKSEVPDTKRHNTLIFCSKENSDNSKVNAEKSKKRKQLSLRKSLPAFRVPNTTITDVGAEKQKSPSSPDLSSPIEMTSETTVYIAEERAISVHSKVESNITDNNIQIPGNEIIANGYDSGTCDNLDFEMTEELLKSFDLPVFNENLTMEPNFDSEKRRKRSLRRSSRHFTLYEMPLSRPSLEAQSEIEELSNQNSSSSTSASPSQSDGGNIIVENSSPLNKCTGNKENVPCVKTDIPTQKYQTLFSYDKQTSSEVDKETIEEITENFNSLYVEQNHEVTRSNRAKGVKIKENQRRKSINIFKACSDNINDLNFHNDYVISQTYDKTPKKISDCMVANSLISYLEAFQGGSKVNFHNEGYLMGEEQYVSDCSGDQNANAVGDIVMQDIASNEAFCDLKAQDDMDTSEESVPKFTKALRSRKSWDFSQVSVPQDNKVTRRKHKVSETITPSTGHLDKMASPSKAKFNEEISPGLKDLYLNKNFVLPKPKTWETIKENPTNNQSIFTKQKFKRILLFEAGVNASKLQRRQKKAALLNKGATTRTTISDQDFEKKLLHLDVELMLDC